ncbi:hypothetical protein [Rickettsia prowazekii]|uniref:hypothetical protein n=1 Tax=Rickettsia prowazekii TaxID=782 RepID=UPI000256BE0A|nr:hypothetical protein [Rickettsia prowazekii]AFE48847.1 hypothetical protein M9W_00070 [Rickettsia prowazekii str. Chernikova]AFE51379.1 hypothetical protein MA3_00070 [Rickettsia prowazekii str. Dachau]AGJ02840.1 hypothetical protein H375_6150 [Rickettsia prowazekii str. Breinl]AMS11949.1 hypothetical protein AR462_00075 [Rickettsia prowazekii]EOB09475.1 hypothetical protein H377_7790 [Rickettsia prowazekii str. Cairo 3]
MNKLTAQNLLKKSRFLKYSLLTSISVGAVMAIPVERIAMGMDQEAFCAELSKKLSLEFSQSYEDTISTTQEKNNLSNNGPSNKSDMAEELANVTTKSLYKVRKMQAPEFKISENKFLNNLDSQTISKELDPNTYTTESISQKPEIILTASSTTVSTDSNSFVTVSTASSLKPVTSYQPTPDFKPNYSLGFNTPINTNLKIVRKLSFSSEQPQIVQHSKSMISLMPTAPVVLPKSSIEIEPEMVSNIPRVDDTISIKSSEVREDIKGTKDQKTLVDQFNSSIGIWSKKTGKNKYDLNKDSSQK